MRGLSHPVDLRRGGGGRAQVRGLHRVQGQEGAGRDTDVLQVRSRRGKKAFNGDLGEVEIEFFENLS